MMRAIWVSLGFICVGVGLVGTFVPLLPTVPMMLLAGFCFARSSPRLHQWLRSHPRFGAAVRDWQDHGGISRHGKRLATLGIAAVCAISALAGVRLSVLAIQAGVLACVLWFIWTRPVPNDPEADTACPADPANRN